MKRKIFFGVILSIMFAFMIPLFSGCFGPRELPKYMVTWRNDDGTVICQKEYQVGEIPEYTEELPTSALNQNDVETTWKFVCWRGEGGYDVRVGEEYYPIDYDEWFTAEYEPETTHFSFCFKNYDGEVLQNVDNIYFEQNFIEDVELSPKKPSQGNLVYYFNGWDINLDSFWHGEASNYVGSNQAKVITATYREVDTTVNTQGLQFALNDEETAYYVNGYNGNSKDIVITATHNNLPVEGIEEHAFYENDNIEYVYIAEGIKHIGDEAFHRCNKLKKVYIPNSIESVGERAFYYYFMEHKTYDTCAYLGNDENPYLVLIDAKSHYQESYEIHPDTKVLASRLFYYNEILTSLVIPNGVKNIPEELCFYTKYIEHVTIPASVKSIGYRAFADSKIRKIILPDGLKEIDNHAFICAETESLSVPDSVERVGGNAF